MRDVDCIAQNYLNNEVLACQSSLIEELISKSFFESEDFRNTLASDLPKKILTQMAIDGGYKAEEDLDPFMLDAEVLEYIEDNGLFDCTVYEWWAVTSWLAGRLVALGCPVIDSGFGYWWGRTTTGQHILMDGILQRIASKEWDITSESALPT